MQTSYSSKRVLIVDDNAQAADVASELLDLCGYQTAVAYGGQQGLQAAASFAPDVILLDLGMPGMDGFQLAAALRARPDFRDVALVAFSAWGDNFTRQRTRAAGFDQHLTKPASLDEIVDTIAAACHA
ncbi:histidine kinase [Duganella sp. Leaf126]|uniref:response regulator n=1 Tax=Duganella sp. Leaf126 TaxID=1736266 RepID=UPI0006F9CB75|nr:response regulator [Duganella sp. Leaf126]KQQ33875.1 histidine kinase [Duganella sp. Leaf126]